MTDIKTNPVPGAQVTMTIEQAEEKLRIALETLGNIISGLPFMVSTQSAMQRLAETRFWVSHALNDKRKLDEQEAQRKKEDDRKASVNAVREKVELNAG